MIREAYEQAAALFVQTVRDVAPNQWGLQALGEWNVQDLVGHTNRALLTVDTYLDNPANARELEHPVSYFLQAMASLGDPAEVAARGRAAGQALGTDRLASVRQTAERVLARLRQTPDDALLTTPVGGMRLIDYLPSRVFELTIHTLDLASALARPITPPASAARVTFSLVTELAIAQQRTVPLLLSALGRDALPPDFSVL